MKETAQHFIEINQAETRIRLRLNRRKPRHMLVLEDIKQIQDLVNGRPAPADLIENLNLLTEKLEADASDLIKAEWERVKRGEPTYVLGKWLTATVFISLSILLGWQLFKLKTPSAPEQPTPPPTHSSPRPQNPSPSSQ
jgi:hypothetical protein